MMELEQAYSDMTQTLAFLFSIIVIATIALYVLRGIGILTFIPGGIFWLLMLLAIFTGLAYGFAKSRR
jgi:fatty acid desaturase